VDSERRWFLIVIDDDRARAEETEAASGLLLALIWAHELRNPLQVISFMTTALRMTDPDPRCLRDLEALASATEHALSLVDGVFELWNSLGEGELVLVKDSFSLRSTVNELCHGLVPEARSRDIDMSLIVAAEVPDVLVGDAVRLRQVLFNLLGNAIKFTDSGKVQLQVEVKYRSQSEVVLGFSVVDNGIGIPCEEQSRIFEPFSRLRSEGTERGGRGLGLFVSRQIVRAMGGELTVTSALVVGSTFHFAARFGVDSSEQPVAKGAHKGSDGFC
jgi:signal transduction histidine kinase